MGQRCRGVYQLVGASSGPEGRLVRERNREIGGGGGRSSPEVSCGAGVTGGAFTGTVTGDGRL